jgi:hypothetical protein
MNAWLQERPRLAALARSVQTVLELADELYQRGRSGGESVDYYPQPVLKLAVSLLSIRKPEIPGEVSENLAQPSRWC